MTTQRVVEWKGLTAYHTYTVKSRREYTAMCDASGSFNEITKSKQPTWQVKCLWLHVTLTVGCAIGKGGGMKVADR